MRRQLGIASLLTASALAWVVAGAAAVAAAPTAITGPVGSVGPTSATVSGTVNPGGQATTWYVEYGTSTSYGSQSASASVGSGSANVAVSRSLSGLAAGTTYHYRVVATNGAGTSRGADGIFTTLSAPAVVTGAAIGRDADDGDAERDGRSERPRDDVVLRVRDEHELRHEDGREGRRLGRQRGRRLGGTREPRPRQAPPLPARRDERRRDEPWRRPDLHDVRGARRHHRRRLVGRADVGAVERHDHSERPVDELVLRLRHEHELRHEDGGQERRLGNARHAGERVADAAADGRHVPLPPRRDQRIRNDGRPRPHLQHRSAARRPDGGGARRDGDDCDPDRLGRPAHESDELVVRVRHDDGLRLPDGLEERGLGRDGARRQRGGLGPEAGNDLPLPPGRAERRGHDARRRRLVDHRRRHAHGSCVPCRLRPRDPALRVRADAARRRDRDRLRASRSARGRRGRSRPS